MQASVFPAGKEPNMKAVSSGLIILKNNTLIAFLISALLWIIITYRVFSLDIYLFISIIMW